MLSLITIIFFIILVIFVTIIYALWGLIFRLMPNSPKLFGLNKLEDYQWEYFKTKSAPKWFASSSIPFALMNAIISYRVAGPISFNQLFSSNLNLIAKLISIFTSYLDFFLTLGIVYVIIFVIEFLISVYVLRYKAMNRPNIEIIIDDGNNYKTSNNTETTRENAEQKRISD